MKTKWILVAAVTAATMTSGCMAFKELSGEGGRSSSSSHSSAASDSDVGALSESEPRDDAPASSPVEATSRAADASARAAAAADRAAAVAARASTNADKTETGFHKSMRK